MADWETANWENGEVGGHGWTIGDLGLVSSRSPGVSVSVSSRCEISTSRSRLGLGGLGLGLGLEGLGSIPAPRKPPVHQPYKIGYPAEG